jgi:hypothetical protein
MFKRFASPILCSIAVSTCFGLCAVAFPARADNAIELLNPPVQQNELAAEEKPAYSGFKGVSIGSTLSEARQKLGNPTDKSDDQDYFMLDGKVTAQVYYDADKKVYAVSVNYLGDKNVPSPKDVFGSDVPANADGSVFKRVNYTHAGYWVAYNRTKGDDPLVTVTMQKSH